MKSPVMPATGLFSGVMIHGGHVEVTINTVNQSPTSHKKQLQRVKRVLDSSDDDRSPPLT